MKAKVYGETSKAEEYNKQLIVTDEGGLRVPGTVIQVVKAEKLDTAATNSTMASGFIDTGMTCIIIII